VAHERLRLLSVIQGPAFGGAHNQLLRLHRPLAARGVETVAVLPAEADTAAARLRDAGVETLQLPLGRLRATPHPGPQARFVAALVPELRRLRGLIRNQRAALVQVHGATNPQGAIAAAMEADVAVVWQLFDTRAPMALRRMTMPLVVRLADAITVWGEQLALVHPGAARLGERLIKVYPPVDTDEFTPDAALAASAREELGVPKGASLIGTVGVLNPQKGHEHLIRAAALLRPEHPQLAVRVLGSPSPAHAAYEARVRAEARRLGLERPQLELRDPGTSVPRLLQAFDVFVMASVPRSEGMPTAILEAMACGKPVVATDVGAVRELVEDGVTGRVVEPESADAIAAAVSELLRDPQIRSAMGAEGRRVAVERFDLDRLADLHRRAYAIARMHRGTRR